MTNQRALRFRSQFSITLTFSPKGITTATLYDDQGESCHSSTSDDANEALDLTMYALDKLVEEYEAEMEAAEREPYEDDRKNGVPESQFLYRRP